MGKRIVLDGYLYFVVFVECNEPVLLPEPLPGFDKAPKELNGLNERFINDLRERYRNGYIIYPFIKVDDMEPVYLGDILEKYRGRRVRIVIEEIDDENP